MRKLSAVFMLFAMICSLLGRTNIVYANENEVVINNSCIKLNDVQAAQLYERIETNIMQRYGEGYEFGTFNVYFEDEALTDESYIIDVDVYANMTLIDDPRESEYVTEMMKAVSDIVDTDMRMYAQQKVAAELDCLMENYNLTQLTGFSYRIVLNPEVLDTENIIDFELYHRVDITDEDVILAVVPADESSSVNKNADAVLNSLFNAEASVYSLSSVTYDEDDAVAYAIAHALDVPEFSSANNNGSDCANFVSYCLNAGGIPIDDAGDWHPRYEGDTWAGTNWMRTGYYNNGGVTTYMEDKGYFSSTDLFSDAVLGSIVYWNTKSHVALVTYVDQNGTIKYTQHSSSTQTVTYRTLSTSSDVTFFVPEI